MAQRRLWGFLGKGKRFLYFQPTSPSSFSCVLDLFAFIATMYHFFFVVFFCCKYTLFQFHHINLHFLNLHSGINSFTELIFNKYLQLQETRFLPTLLGTPAPSRQVYGSSTMHQIMQTQVGFRMGGGGVKHSLS